PRGPPSGRTTGLSQHALAGPGGRHGPAVPRRTARPHRPARTGAYGGGKIVRGARAHRIAEGTDQIMRVNATRRRTEVLG
ncbi:hypothetical protein ACWEPI_24720, partial [Streptomyces sp. NPDC004262]